MSQLYPPGTDPFGVGHQPPEGIKMPGLHEPEGENAVKEDLAKAVAEIQRWWVDLAERDADITAPKAIEYGSMDLDIMGEAMMALNPEAWGAATPEERKQIGQEMAVIFYIQGKLGRALSSLQQGERPKDDTRFDIRVYANMWERIATTGRWI